MDPIDIRFFCCCCVLEHGTGNMIDIWPFFLLIRFEFDISIVSFIELNFFDIILTIATGLMDGENPFFLMFCLFQHFFSSLNLTIFFIIKTNEKICDIHINNEFDIHSVSRKKGLMESKINQATFFLLLLLCKLPIFVCVCERSPEVDYVNILFGKSIFIST